MRKVDFIFIIGRLVHEFVIRSTKQPSVHVAPSRSFGRVLRSMWSGIHVRAWVAGATEDPDSTCCCAQPPPRGLSPPPEPLSLSVAELSFSSLRLRRIEARQSLVGGSLHGMKVTWAVACDRIRTYMYELLRVSCSTHHAQAPSTGTSIYRQFMQYTIIWKWICVVSKLSVRYYQCCCVGSL